MKPSAITAMPIYYDRYINLVGDVELMQALQNTGKRFLLAEEPKLRALGDRVYAPGKWTVKDIIQHLTDCERVFTYRAMAIARGDKTHLPGFDENLYAENTSVSSRSFDDVIAEFSSVRESSIFMFGTLAEEALSLEGTVNSTRISPLAIGFVLAGHVIHHMNVIKERYYPLL